MTSDPLLTKWYKQYNKKYFNNDLPVENVILCWEPIPEHDALCSKIYEADTDKDTGDFLIRIDPMYVSSERISRLTLLHEMLHIKLWPYVSHGDRFQKEMIMLAVAGAFKKLW